MDLIGKLKGYSGNVLALKRRWDDARDWDPQREWCWCRLCYRLWLICNIYFEHTSPGVYAHASHRNIPFVCNSSESSSAAMVTNGCGRSPGRTGALVGAIRSRQPRPGGTSAKRKLL